MMAHNVDINEAAVNALRTRDPSPELRGGNCWSGFLCLGTCKRGKRIVPASRLQEGSASSSRVSVPDNSSSSVPNQVTGLSPSLLAPPSSPASFANSANASSVQSPTGYAVSLSLASANECSAAGMSFDSTAMMFTIGPYAHETALVTPPAFSAITTAPSTAPFTPPPELVQFTTPSSPDVPFAQLLAASLCEKGTAQEAMASYRASFKTSPDKLASTGLGSCDMEYQTHKSGARTLFKDETLCFPTLKPDTASEIDAAYVASILLSQVSMGFSSPSRTPQPHEEHIINKGRLSFGFEEGLSSILADQQVDTWYQHSHNRESQFKDDVLLAKIQYEIDQPNIINSSLKNSPNEKTVMRSTPEDHINLIEKKDISFEGCSKSEVGTESFVREPTDSENFRQGSLEIYEEAKRRLHDLKENNRVFFGLEDLETSDESKLLDHPAVGADIDYSMKEKLSTLKRLSWCPEPAEQTLTASCKAHACEAEKIETTALEKSCHSYEHSRVDFENQTIFAVENYILSSSSREGKSIEFDCQHIELMSITDLELG
ncbi:hypothetical protein O6H91_19G055200 [Diphasiastrum complanatum]|uniref:Uncharacterized protein n=3 Tax=Diphasiastrum complanatum TaxID=34168 RepID=A0ACC2AVA9_DIPCM|nr:hypothetical protein O6H91_19G055200 [Diphasiastrum complanatum]KAJ7521450.1 hypothetical protein O6H91_19G055200 [Diphasiastrum complanatum]KAJ7521452.1 hypothetical protein O6H91_19G055200 [Diphasiastrum complanatum]